MNLAFIVPFRHAGLALAIALGACLNAALLYRFLRKQGIYAPQPGWPVFVAKVTGAVAAMAAALHYAMGPAAWWLGANWQQKVPAVAGLVLLGAAVYLGLLYAFGLRGGDFARREAS
jgi:putative peptidoglycan lipid II flippase